MSLFCGYGSPKPVSREKTGGLFGHVEDAFEGKSLTFEGKPRRKSRDVLEDTESMVSEEAAATAEPAEPAEPEPEVEAAKEPGPCPVLPAVRFLIRCLLLQHYS